MGTIIATRLRFGLQNFLPVPEPLIWILAADYTLGTMFDIAVAANLVIASQRTPIVILSLSSSPYLLAKAFIAFGRSWHQKHTNS